MKDLYIKICTALEMQSDTPPAELYSQVKVDLLELCNRINATPEDEMEDVWFIDTYMGISIVDLIVGAYWFFTDYHEGQASESYALLCALGSIFKPNMSSAPTDDDDPGAKCAMDSLETLHNAAHPDK